MKITLLAISARARSLGFCSSTTTWWKWIDNWKWGGFEWGTNWRNGWAILKHCGQNFKPSYHQNKGKIWKRRGYGFGWLWSHTHFHFPAGGRQAKLPVFDITNHRMIVGTGDTVCSKGICKKMVLSFSGLTVTMYFLLLELGGIYTWELQRWTERDWPQRLAKEIPKWWSKGILHSWGEKSFLTPWSIHWNKEIKDSLWSYEPLLLRWMKLMLPLQLWFHLYHKRLVDC